MLLQRKMRLCLWVLFFSVPQIIHAGTLGALEAPSFAGFLLGVGGGYVNANLSKWTDVTMVSTFAPVTEYYREDNIKDTLSPVVNASYFHHMVDGWLLGI